jgi:hypothetical protein
MVAANILAYYDKATICPKKSYSTGPRTEVITAVKSFMKLVPGPQWHLPVAGKKPLQPISNLD